MFFPGLRHVRMLWRYPSATQPSNPQATFSRCKECRTPLVRKLTFISGRYTDFLHFLSHGKKLHQTMRIKWRYMRIGRCKLARVCDECYAVRRNGTVSNEQRRFFLKRCATADAKMSALKTEHANWIREYGESDEDTESYSDDDDESDTPQRRTAIRNPSAVIRGTRL